MEISRDEGVVTRGSIGDAGPGGNYLTRLAYQAPVNGYYTVLVGLLNEYGVQYEITVR